MLNTPDLSFACHVTICMSLVCPGFCHEINSVNPKEWNQTADKANHLYISYGDEQEYGC